MLTLGHTLSPLGQFLFTAVAVAPLDLLRVWDGKTEWKAVDRGQREAPFHLVSFTLFQVTSSRFYQHTITCQTFKNQTLIR